MDCDSVCAGLKILYTWLILYIYYKMECKSHFRWIERNKRSIWNVMVTFRPNFYSFCRENFYMISDCVTFQLRHSFTYRLSKPVISGTSDIAWVRARAMLATFHVNNARGRCIQERDDALSAMPSDGDDDDDGRNEKWSCIMFNCIWDGIFQIIIIIVIIWYVKK